MKQTKKKQIAPSCKTALITAVCLLVCAVSSIVLYLLTSYLPLLLAALLQALPAVANLLLMIPRLPAKTPPEPETEPEPSEALSTEELVEEQKPKLKKRERMRNWFARLGRWFYDLWANSRDMILLITLSLLTIGGNVYFWIAFAKTGRAYALGYHLPVIMLVFFVLYIVLDKWCKHVGDSHRHTKNEQEHAEETEDELQNASPEETYNGALLHSLRGALMAGRWSQIVIVIALMVRLMGYGDYTRVANILVAVLFVYETAFLLISLVVRYIRREIATAPELSIPMPGLGGEDLGVISYLEKNTGITMRSLWSIRLVKNIIPYSVLVVVVLLWGFSGVVKIEPHQEGAHYRLGRLQEETLQPGLHMTLPWPFDTVEVYDTKVTNSLTIGYISEESTDNLWTQTHGTEEYKLLLGGGNELVSINLRVNYRIQDLKAYLAGSASPEALMQAAAYEIVTEKTISTDLNTLLAADRTAFAEEFKAELIERTAAYNTGLQVIDVVLESIHPPVDIADVYQQLISAGIDAERILLSAEARRQVTLIEANSLYYSTVGAAEAEKLAAIAAAEAAVSEFLAQVEAEKDWSGEGFDYKYHKYLQAITAAYADGRIVIVGEGIDSSNIYIGNVGIVGSTQ